MTRTVISGAALAVAVLLSACSDQEALLAPDLQPMLSSTGTNIYYTGQGTFLNEDGDRVLGEEICGVENGAEVDGPYLLWILTANGAENATLFVLGEGEPMARAGGGNSVFKVITDYHDLDDLIDEVYGTYWGGRVRGSVQLVISHGCLGVAYEGCSQGYWGQRSDAAWLPIARTQKFFDIFVVENERGLHPDLTLGEAINLTGGRWNSLARHAVAAFLNAEHVNYYMDSAAVVAAVVAAFNSDDWEDLAEELDAANGEDTECPLAGNL
jgi:hypothetical protein